MTFKRFIKAVVLLICVIGTSLAVRHIMAQAHVPVAFTAALQRTYFEYPSGRFVKTEEVNYAVRSDGSSVEQRFHMNADQRAIRDLTDRKNVTVEGISESVTTYPLSEKAVTNYRTLAATCAASGSERSSILGYEVVKVIEDAGPTYVESWVAPGLDCFEMKSIAYHRLSDGKNMPLTISETLWVSLGEPNPQLFQIPAGYTERAPSGVVAELYRRHPELKPSTSKDLQALNAAYARQDAAYRRAQLNR